MNFIKLIRLLLNFFDYFQQKKIINFFKKQSINKLVLFDVGAHHGETVLLFYKNLNINRIHCFEASTQNFKVLENNIKKKKLKNICRLNNFAAGEIQKNFFINQTKESSSSSINEFNKNSNYYKKKIKILNFNKVENFYKKIPIKMMKLSDYIDENKITKIDILKIDTEGYELKVLEGLTPKHNIVKFIYFEHHYDDMILKKYTFKNINKILLKYGFKKVYKSKMTFRKSFEYIYKNLNY
tara:strand:+ start:85 stop:804 length:720 start_codon:yes stop_codon:yes gene_type:complete